jgi:hypothetical protein
MKASLSAAATAAHAAASAASETMAWNSKRYSPASGVSMTMALGCAGQ